MDWYYIVLLVILLIIILVFLTAYICYRMTFFVNRKKARKNIQEDDLPPGEIYKPFKDIIISGMKNADELPHQDINIKSFDELDLHGKYYECLKGAPIEIMFHGYKGSAKRDLSNGIERCFKLNRNALIVDQRTSGLSGGHIISFGVNERKDCLSWINYVINHFGKDVKIIITGISMGAATVIMAAGMDLPSNVIGVLSDCSYNKAEDIIKKCIKDMRLPANIFYPFVKLGARVYGRFNLNEASPIEAIKKCKIPIILYHGENDDFVPCHMSQKLYDACNVKKRLVTIPHAGHGLCYLVDPDKYLYELKDFFD